jgi:hypothetical protein
VKPPWRVGHLARQGINGKLANGIAAAQLALGKTSRKTRIVKEISVKDRGALKPAAAATGENVRRKIIS